MKKYHGGEIVAKGVYLNLSTWELGQQYGDNPVLPGGEKVTYIKVPGPLAVAGSPFAGLAFIIFLPFIAIVGAISFLVYKLGWGATVVTRKVLQPVMVSWMPGRAYLTRKGSAKEDKKIPDDLRGKLPNMSIDEIEEEITRRRQRGEK